MPKLLIRPEAEVEIADALNWYKLQAEGLSSEFLRAVDACINSVERMPLAYPVVHQNIRRALLRKFPYGIFFVCETDEDEERIVVLACFHARRDPKGWQSRAT